MEPIISKLNGVAQKSLKESGSSDLPKPSSDFQKTFDDTMANRLMEKMQSDYGFGGGQNQMTVLSADNIQVKTQGASEVSGAAGSANDQIYEMFKNMNKDVVNIDVMIDHIRTSQSSGKKISPDQLLAMQAGVAQAQIMAEGFTRFADSAARFVQNVTSMQM